MLKQRRLEEIYTRILYRRTYIRWSYAIQVVSQEIDLYISSNLREEIERYVGSNIQWKEIVLRLCRVVLPSRRKHETKVVRGRRGVYGWLIREEVGNGIRIDRCHIRLVWSRMRRWKIITEKKDEYSNSNIYWNRMIGWSVRRWLSQDDRVWLMKLIQFEWTFRILIIRIA